MKQILDLPPGRIILAAVLLRLVFCYAWGLFVNAPPENVPVEGATYFSAGADGYLQIARTLITDGSYAFSPDGPAVHNRPPVQPALMLLFGAWWAQRWYLVWFIASALLSWLTLRMTWTAAGELGLDDRRAKLALLLAAFHPYSIFITKTTTFINAAALTLTAATALTLRARSGRARDAAAAGAVMGLGALTHGTLLPLPLVAAPWLLADNALPPARRVRNAVVLLLAAGAVVAPWTLRNALTFERFIPVVTGSGYHYWKGSAVYFGGDYPMKRVYEQATGKPFAEMYYGATDPEMDAVLWREAKRDMLAHPERLPLRLIIGTWDFLAPWAGMRGKQLVSAVLNIPLALAILAGLVFAWRRGRLRSAHLLLLGVLAYVVLSFAFFCSWASYFTMLVPVAVLLVVALWSPRAFAPVPPGGVRG